MKNRYGGALCQVSASVNPSYEKDYYEKRPDHLCPNGGDPIYCFTFPSFFCYYERVCSYASLLERRSMEAVRVCCGLLHGGGNGGLPFFLLEIAVPLWRAESVFPKGEQIR